MTLFKGEHSIFRLLLFSLLCIPVFCFGEIGSETEDSGYFAAVGIDFGFSGYTGAFREHLIADGAWLYAPEINLTFYAFPTAYWGLAGVVSSGSVVHINSSPIEGVITYVGISSVFRWDFDPLGLQLFQSVGYLHPGMLISWYASAYWELGGSVLLHLNREFALKLGGRYRGSFFNSLIIHKNYDSITENDPIESFGFSLGLVTKFY